MSNINEISGLNITVYHDFNDEVDFFRQHIWKCNGICSELKPYYGIVKRSMNKPPGIYDLWWKNHEKTCGGSFIKISEPEKKNNKIKKVKKNFKKIDEFFKIRNPEKKIKENNVQNYIFFFFFFSK